MTKRILAMTIICWLWASASMAIPPALLHSLGTSSCTGYDCSGTAGFLWECNSTTVGDTVFCPYGCSDGDTTATANGTVSISAGTCVIDDTVGGNGSDYYAFDVSTDNLVSHDVNTVFIRFKVTTWVNDTDFFSYYGDANDFIRFKPVTADDINLQYVSSGAYVAISTSDATLAVGTEYIARVRWRTADVNPNLTINVYNTSMVEQGTGASSNTNPAGVDATAGASGWRIGNGFPDAVGGALIIYYVHSYKEWLDVDPNL